MLHCTAFFRIFFRNLLGMACSREASVRTTTSASSIILSVSSLGLLCETSTPTSSIASTTNELTRTAGNVPALEEFIPSALENPSAITLRLEFSMHTNRKRLFRRSCPADDDMQVRQKRLGLLLTNPEAHDGHA